MPGFRSVCPNGHHFLLIPLSSFILGPIPAWEVETAEGNEPTGQGAVCPTWALASQLSGTKTKPLRPVPGSSPCPSPWGG